MQNEKERDDVNDNVNDNVNAHFRSGVVGIVGRPSVGKSTFLNAVCRKNTSITSTLPQTTRSLIRGIVTRQTFQILFLDTPGIHFSRKSFSTALRNQSISILKGVDVVLYMLDLSRPIKNEEMNITRLVSRTPHCVLACNKADIPSRYTDEYASHLARFFPSHSPHFISAKNRSGLREMLYSLARLLPVGPLLYPKDHYTDQSVEMRICEQIRGAAIEHLYAEVPHALYVHLLEYSIKHRAEDASPHHVFARAEVMVETESQRRILIGHGGKMIKKIRLSAMRKLRNIFDYRIQLELRVGIKKKWRRDERLLRSLFSR